MNTADANWQPELDSTATSNRLPVLASEIRRAHADVHDAAKTAAQRAIDAGHALIEAKSLCDHGQWLPWLREHCALAERTAQLYMKIAKSGHSPDIVAALGIKAAETALTLKYCFHRPLFEGEAHQQREWRLFALFLVQVGGLHPSGVGDHIDWIGRKNFVTVEEWLTEGPRWMRQFQGANSDCEEIDARRLANWHQFREQHAHLTVEEIDAAFEAEAAQAPEPASQPRPRRRVRRKSATVADFGGAP